MRFALALAVLFATASPAFDRKAWEESPEAYFMTADERVEWQAVKSDDDARRFIAAFYARRSGNFAAEVVRRAEIVDERLAIGEKKASRTLRGKVGILLGAPAELRARHIPKPYRGSMGVATPGRSGAVNRGRPAVGGSGAEGWLEYTFRFVNRPELGIGPEGWTVVIEADVISGKDWLKHKRDKERLEQILDAAARVSLRAKDAH